MANFLKALRSGVHAAKDSWREGGKFTVADRPVKCSHCEHDRFVEGKAQLNTPMMTLIGLDWANRSAATLACVRCGHLEWFLEEPEFTP
jgi:hypothetical protein